MEAAGRQNLKRKRQDESKEDLEIRLSGKIHHELHEVQHACKKAKVFETQKLVKKLKELRKKDGDASAIQDQEAQLTSLKAVDHILIGNTALRTKVLKDRTLRESEPVQSALDKEVNSKVIEPAILGTPLAKVQSRLLSSKIVASQVAVAVENLRCILDPERPRPGKPLPTSSASSIKLNGTQRPLSEDTLVAEEDASSSADSESEGGAEEAGWESGSVNDNDAESDGGSEEERGSGSSSESQDSSSDDEENGEGSDDDDEKPMPSKKATKPTTTGQPSSSNAQSTFLPSLAVGYIAGSDDSDVEDESKIAEPKKNRRGQRARRAIWEKKYGRNANHKKAESLQPPHRSRFGATRPDFQRNAPLQTGQNNGPPQKHSQSDRRQSMNNSSTRPSSWQQSTHAPGNSSTLRAQRPPVPKPQEKAQPLHPSWEAKRKLRERERDAIVPSQGKKIKF